MDQPDSLDEFFGGLEAMVTDQDVTGAKAVTIILDDTGGQYNTVTTWFGMTAAEVVALLEYTKMGVMMEMENVTQAIDKRELN